MNNSPLLQCTDVRKAFPKPDGAELLVLEGMNLELREGQIVGLRVTLRQEKAVDFFERWRFFANRPESGRGAA